MKSVEKIYCCAGIQQFEKNYRYVEKDQYENMCKQQEIYEILTNEKPIKLYFDLDIGGRNEDITNDLYKTILPILQTQLTKIFKLDKLDEKYFEFALANAFGESKGKIKNSIHIFLPKLVMYQSQQLNLVKTLNREIYLNCQLKNEILNFCFENGSLFDESVYNNKRKMRAIHVSKKGENRPTYIRRFLPQANLINPLKLHH